MGPQINRKSDMQKQGLTETLQEIEDKTDGETITFGDVVAAINHRGFGTLLIAPALIGILPTGAIPFMPDIVALFIILIAGQMIAGRSYPWMPRRLEEFSFSREKYLQSVEKAEPYTKWIDSFFHPRFKFLTGEIAERFVAVFCIILAIAIAILGFVPFAAAIPCAAVLLFGLGLSIHDGLLTAAGFALMTLSLIAIPYLWSSLPF